MKNFNRQFLLFLGNRNNKQIHPILSNKKSPQTPTISKRWSGAVLVLSFAGFLDSAYLSLQHYLGFEVTCSLVHGCEQVLTSSYSVMFGIPVALLGVLYYLAVFLAMVAYLDRKQFVFFLVAVILPIIGFFFTLWFLFVQAILLKAFCLYCLVSAGITVGLFVLSAYYIFYGYRKGIGRNGAV